MPRCGAVLALVSWPLCLLAAAPASTRALTGTTVCVVCGLPCVRAPLRSAQLVDLIDNWEAYAGDKDEVKGDSVRRQVATYCMAMCTCICICM